MPEQNEDPLVLFDTSLLKKTVNTLSIAELILVGLYKKKLLASDAEKAERKEKRQLKKKRKAEKESRSKSEPVPEHDHDKFAWGYCLPLMRNVLFKIKSTSKNKKGTVVVKGVYHNEEDDTDIKMSTIRTDKDHVPKPKLKKQRVLEDVLEPRDELTCLMGM